jgi:hypothetical protein
MTALRTPHVRVPITTPNDGQITREWLLLLQGLVVLTERIEARLKVVEAQVTALENSP